VAPAILSGAVPELPDVALYVEALAERVLGRPLERLRLKSMFLLRSAVPPLSAAMGRPVTALGRLGKRISIELGPGPRAGEPERLVLLLHLMIAGRLHWRERGAALTRRTDLAAFDFDPGTLVLTEAGTKKRASLYLVADEAGLRAHDRGGLEPLTAERAAFEARLRSAPHTLKRALCDPRLLSGIGNAYSDEILHRARLSPLQRVENLSGAEFDRLHAATRAVLGEWIERLRREAGGGFPEKVTAFREGMAVHGRFGRPCPVCAAPIQRIVRAENEFNYCARCQTGGKLLKDRALSQLLKDDWPSSLEELEER
jgi:formamidopyrimidine-DNA glycosylase